MTDVSSYGVTQNPDAALVTADALVGTPVGGQTAESAYGSAAMFSTAPYVPPDPVARLDARHTESMCIARVASKGGALCHAAKVRGTDYCIFHKAQA